MPYSFFSSSFHFRLSHYAVTAIHFRFSAAFVLLMEAGSGPLFSPAQSGYRSSGYAPDLLVFHRFRVREFFPFALKSDKFQLLGVFLSWSHSDGAALHFDFF